MLNYQSHPLPEPFNSWMTGFTGGNMAVALRHRGVGGALQMLNEFAAAYGTKIQVDTGQRMVYDLRARLLPASAGARAAPSRHDEHRGCGVPHRRRRVCHREPGDERRIPARDLGRDAAVMFVVLLGWT